MRIFYTGIICCLFNLLTGSAIAQNVWTQHNDQGRTGWYPYESTLNLGNVNSNTFGLFFSHTTDDKVVSQPLVVLKVNIPNKGPKNIVFATTLNCTIYAYDADMDAAPYWQQNYTNKIAAFPGADCSGCRPALNSDIHPSLCGGSFGDFSGNMGIVGTPVIDTLAGTMYFITKIVNPNDGAIDNHHYTGGINANGIKDEYSYTTTGFHQYLHAIDITTGIDRPNSPVEITATSTGTGDGQTSANSGIIKFNPRTQFNRAGLAMRNGILYMAFAAHCDFNPSHGWILSYDANTLTQLHAYNPTPNDGRGGAWMSGTAPAIDENGNIYFTTGNSLNENQNSNNYNTYNSTLASDPANRGEGVIKLAPDLTLSSYFTPYNYVALNQADKDFPIQVMLLPNTNLAMTGCKDGNIYVMDKTNLGGFNAPPSTVNSNKQTVSNGGTMHSSFAYFGGSTPFAYQYSENTQLRAYPVTSNGLLTGSSAKTNTAIAGPSGGTGGFLSVSSKGTDATTGILWAYQPITGCNANNNNCHAVLHALNASDITKELWNSDIVPADQVNIFNKFSCPTIALGKVYIAASLNHLYCYGLKPNTTCLNNVAKLKPVTALTGAATSANVTDGDLATSWTANNNDVDSIFVDLQGSYDICKIAIIWANNKYAKDFDLKISDDKITWTTVNAFRGNALTYSEFNSPVTARYVNMVGIKRGTANSYGINEFQVFGSAASSCRAPNGLTAVSLSPSTERLGWEKISSAVQYVVKYRNNLSSSWITRTATTNSIDISALTCGSVYYFSVQADCGAVQSTVSQGGFTTADCTASNCEIFPVRYYSVDLGDIGMAGVTCKSGTNWRLSGSGSDIGGNADQFQYAYTNNDIGNYDITARIIQQDPATTINSTGGPVILDEGNTSNKAGIMVRDSITNTSRFAFLGSINSGDHFIFEYRDLAGGPVTTISSSSHFTIPYWLKINKTSTTYSAFVSADNISWTQIGPQLNLNFGTDPSNIPNFGMAVTSTDNTKLATATFDMFSYIGSAPLPIRLVSFTAKKVSDDNILISWATSMEHLVDHFEVQSSTDNNRFQTIEEVKTKGESEITRNYSVHDTRPSTGMNYYRLKEVDRDNKFYISPVAAVKIDRPAGVEIYPNPALEYTSINSGNETILEVHVYDITGKLLQSVSVQDETNSYRLNTTSLTKGIYIITVKTKKELYRQKLFRQ